MKLAVRFSPPAVVTFLLARGTDVNARYPGGQCALHYAAYRDVAIVRALLDGGADINAQDRAGETPLMVAVRFMLMSSFNMAGKAEIIEELLERGADVSIRDITGKTVLDYMPRGLWSTLWYGPWFKKVRNKIMKYARRAIG